MAGIPTFWQERWQENSGGGDGLASREIPEEAKRQGCEFSPPRFVPSQDLPNLGSGRWVVPVAGDLSAGSGVAILAGGENVGMAKESGATRGGSGFALGGGKKHSVDFNEGRDIVSAQTSGNALVNGHKGEAPMAVFHLPGNMRAPRGEFCCLTFAKSDNAGRSSGSRLAGLDLHPSECFGGVDLGGEDGKAAGELAGGFGSALAVEDAAETVEAFAGEH